MYRQGNFRVQMILRTRMLSLGTTSLAFGQQSNAAPEMRQIRQAMTEQYAAAVAKKDPVAMADHDTRDIVTAGLCPEAPPVVGHDAKTRQSDASLQAGRRDDSGGVKEVRLL